MRCMRLASVLLVANVFNRSVARSQASRAGYIKIDSSRLYFEECGHGDALVLLHDGLLHSARRT